MNKPQNEQIFCIIRRRYVTQTPEEQVRQSLISYLINETHYPQTLISVEAQINVGQLTRRYDAVVYTSDWQPWMLIECKKNEVELSQSTISQILAYNTAVHAPFLLITNGIKSYCFSVFEKKQLTALPPYPAKI